MSPRVRQYAREEASRYGIRAGWIFTRDRSAAVSGARKAVMRRLISDGFSSSQIAGWLNREPSTVRHLTGGRA